MGTMGCVRVWGKGLMSVGGQIVADAVSDPDDDTEQITPHASFSEDIF